MTEDILAELREKKKPRVVDETFEKKYTKEFDKERRMQQKIREQKVCFEICCARRLDDGISMIYFRSLPIFRLTCQLRPQSCFKRIGRISSRGSESGKRLGNRTLIALLFLKLDSRNVELRRRA